MITIVGSSSLWPIPPLAMEVLQIMLRHKGETFGVRSNRRGDLASGTEDLVAKLGDRLHEHVLPWPPVNGGGSSAFVRDNLMVSRSIAVYCFFGPDALMVGGTGHVAAVALRQGVKLTAYTLDDFGSVTRVAEDDGDLLELWSE